MSEKLDGVRGVWNGRELISRHGKVILCPSWFSAWFVLEIATAGMTLDGELWMGRGTTHEDVMAQLNSSNGDWNRIGYYIFDIPSSCGTYEERMKLMGELKSLPHHVHIIQNIQCTGPEHLISYLDSIVADQGEGVMLRMPQTKNVLQYTPSLLKVKVSYDFNLRVQFMFSDLRIQK